MPTTSWTRLAKAVRETRERELRISQDDLARRADIGVATLRKIERGQETSYKAFTLRRLEKSLGWTVGSIDDVLAGRAPTPLVEAVRQEDLRSPHEQLRNHLDRLIVHATRARSVLDQIE